MPERPTQTPRRWFTLALLILAGEMIFCLPFHLPRYFRPSVLETFGLSNAELGDVFAVYGVTAMLTYFPGGILADRIAPRRLMAASLAATALGGVYLLTIPQSLGLAVLYGYWGVTTIFLFWAAMIRATRQWGGRSAQGRAFGLLEGGRGLAAAGFATLAVMCFAAFVPDPDGVPDADQRRAAMQAVIGFYTAITALAAALVWAFLPNDGRGREQRAPFALQTVTRVLRQPLVWMQALIVVVAYCGYKGLDNYALYAYEVLGMGEVAAASFTASAAYIRPLAAVSAGLIADRCGAGRSIAVLFAALAVVYALLGSFAPTPALLSIIYLNIIVSFVAVFALRALYFALLEETRVPAQLTGTAVGLVSVVGYTPDIFFAPIAGRLLDATPGLGGHQHYFLLLAGIAVVGTLTAAALTRRVARQSQQEIPL